MHSSKVAAALDALIKAIKDEIRSDFLNALGGEGRPVRRGRRGGGAARPARASKAIPLRARAKGAKRTPDELEALTGSVLNYIRKHPASRVEQIAAGLGTTTKELALPIGKLWDAAALKVEGQRRGMKYTAK